MCYVLCVAASMEPCLNRPPANGHSMRVLLVEDEKKVASFVARALREDTYAVDVAENGQKALELATRKLYDAILLDVRLPGLMRIQVCRELRELGIETPILLRTPRTLLSHGI